MNALRSRFGHGFRRFLLAAGCCWVLANAPPLTASEPPATLRVAAVQMRSSRDLDDNVARIRETLAQCAADGVRVAVFPECALTGYYEELRTALTAEEVARAEAQVAAACKEAKNTVFIVHANAPANADATGSHGHSRIIAPDGNLIEEASIFEEQTLTATLDLKEATARNALKSITRGPLIEWWREGMKQVRRVE